MSPRRKLAGLLFILLMLTYEFHPAVLVLASANNDVNGYEIAYARDVEFLRRQLENNIPPEGPLLERSYVIPAGMNLSHADELWMTMAPLISLGYDENQIVKVLGESALPRALEADGVEALIDYDGLRVIRDLEDGEVSVEIPLLCNTSLPSTYYEVKGVKKRIKLYNITSTKYYNVSVDVHRVYNVTYCIDETGGFSKAILSIEGDLKNNVINVFLPGLSKPVFSEIRFESSHGVTLSLSVIEHKVRRISLDGKEVDCYWIRVKRVLKAERDVWGVMLSIGHGGGWIISPWLILRKGEYASEHWVKWINGNKLIIELSIRGFKDAFILNFNNATNEERSILSRVLNEDELKKLVKQPPYKRLNLSRVPKGWDVKFVDERVTNETIWVTSKEYERLSRLGWRDGNSIFMDPGEVKWEYSITNRTFGSRKSIRLFYKPLEANKGELVHGITLRNYANSNLSYTLRLRTATNVFLFFSKVDEGSGAIRIGRESSIPLLLVQQGPAVGDATLELVKDDRVIAAVRVYLALKATTYWKGFWDGLATKFPEIITAGVMVAMSFLIPHAYIRPAYYLPLGIGVLTNLLEVANDVAEANKARGEMLSLAEALENRSREFLVNDSVEHAEECRNLALALRQEALSSPMLNVLSSLAIGVSWDEIRIALGLKEPIARDELEKQYRIGYARGRVTGTVISCILYVALYNGQQG